MIECANCDSAHFLHITKSRLRFDGDTPPPTEVSEEYECTACNGTGEYNGNADADEPDITGDIRFTGGRNQAGLLWP